MKYPAEWKIRGICVDAPRSEDVGLLIRLIRERFAADGINTMVLLLRYRFAFETHPECRGDDPLSKSDVSAIRAVCKENGIELIPKMNLFGHQSNQFNKTFPVIATIQNGEKRIRQLKWSGNVMSNGIFRPFFFKNILNILSFGGECGIIYIVVATIHNRRNILCQFQMRF